MLIGALPLRCYVETHRIDSSDGAVRPSGLCCRWSASPVAIHSALTRCPSSVPRAGKPSTRSAASLCPLRPAVCLASGHGLYTGPSLPRLSATAAGFPTGLDPLPLSSAIAGSHLLVQVSRQTYTGTATRAPHDQRPAMRDRRRHNYPCALTPGPFTRA
jgi:hypothetical protein